MSSRIRKFHQPERLNWKTSWRILKDRLNVRLSNLDPSKDESCHQLLVDLLVEMKLIEKGSSLP